MASPSRVSVVIPAYKAAGTICRAVDSVLAQTHPAHEIIIVDDGSPDHQVEVIERAYRDTPQVILIRQANAKTAKARNTGIERATGDFIAFLDADDYWEPEKLAVQLRVFQTHPEVSIVAGCSYEELPGEPRTSSSVSKTRSELYDRVLQFEGRQLFHLATIIWTGTVVARREAIGDHRFVSGLEPAEDRDFWVRIIRNRSVYLISHPLATAVLQPDSLSRSGAEKDCRNMLRVVDRNRELLGNHGLRLWRSYTLYRWAANEPNPLAALPRLIESYVRWPLPYDKSMAYRSWGRAKCLGRLMADILRLRRIPPDPNVAL